MRFYDKAGRETENELLVITADNPGIDLKLTEGLSEFDGENAMMTGWKHKVSDITVPLNIRNDGGECVFEILIEDVGDKSWGGTVLADNIRFGTKTAVYHSGDYNPPDFRISLQELLRVIQLYNTEHYHCNTGSGDGYALGENEYFRSCDPHDSDYNPQNWHISLSELLRFIQFYTDRDGYREEDGTEDGFTPMAASYDPPEISISPGFQELEDIWVGETADIGFTVDFDKNDGKTYTVSVTQEIHDVYGNIYPAGSDLSPLSVTNIGWTRETGMPKTWNLTQIVTGTSGGLYGIATTARIHETGEIAESTAVLSVIPVVSLELPGPSRITVSEATDVTFRAELIKTDRIPDKIIIEEVDESRNPVRSLPGRLGNDGASDGTPVYSGRFTVVPHTEGRLFFRAKATFQNGKEEYSNVVQLFVKAP